jgi:hypothetical protein
MQLVPFGALLAAWRKCAGILGRPKAIQKNGGPHFKMKMEPAI